MAGRSRRQRPSGTPARPSRRQPRRAGDDRVRAGTRRRPERRSRQSGGGLSSQAQYALLGVFALAAAGTAGWAFKDEIGQWAADAQSGAQNVISNPGAVFSDIGRRASIEWDTDPIIVPGGRIEYGPTMFTPNATVNNLYPEALDAAATYEMAGVNGYGELVEQMTIDRHNSTAAANLTYIDPNDGVEAWFQGPGGRGDIDRLIARNPNMSAQEISFVLASLINLSEPGERDEYINHVVDQIEAYQQQGTVSAFANIDVSDGGAFMALVNSEDLEGRNYDQTGFSLVTDSGIAIYGQPDQNEYSNAVGTVLGGNMNDGSRAFSSSMEVLTRRAEIEGYSPQEAQVIAFAAYHGVEDTSAAERDVAGYALTSLVMGETVMETTANGSVNEIINFVPGEDYQRAGLPENGFLTALAMLELARSDNPVTLDAATLAAQDYSINLPGARSEAERAMARAESLYALRLPEYIAIANSEILQDYDNPSELADYLEYAAAQTGVGSLLDIADFARTVTGEARLGETESTGLLGDRNSRARERANQSAILMDASERLRTLNAPNAEYAANNQKIAEALRVAALTSDPQRLQMSAPRPN